MIAFVVVAAALAFVVLNMGMFTTQRAREVIARGLGEASSALEVDGSVTALTNSSKKVVFISIPVKLAPGREAVDLNENKTVIAVFTSNGLAFENAHQKIMNLGDLAYINLTDLCKNITVTTDKDKYINVSVVFVKEITKDSVLEFGEKALIVIKIHENKGLDAYGKIRVEIRPPEGAPLTIERMIPAILPANQSITLG